MQRYILLWTWITPLLGWALLAGIWAGLGGSGATDGTQPLVASLQAAMLIGCVLSAVHHAEVVAHRVGEPFGTLVLALAVTVIEVALIVSLMLSGEDGATTLARDTIFAAIMIILNGMVGVCLLVGGSRHREQVFGVYGVNAALTTLAALSVISMILPNTTTSVPGPVYSTGQLIFVALVSVVLYGGFVLVQTVRHRDYFVMKENGGDSDAPHPSRSEAMISAALLVLCLGAVVLLAKSLSPAIERAVAQAGAPKAVVGIIIATIVLLPESLAALNAARMNRLQTSLNLALGSALASIGLTIPAVAAVAAMTGWRLELGLDAKGTVLLALSLILATLSLGTGRTTVLQGLVHVVIFFVYLFTTIIP